MTTPTREEFLGGIDRYRVALSGFLNESWHGKDPVTEAFYAVQCEEARADLLAAYDAQAARVKELEGALAIERTTATNRLELLRSKDARVKELEAAGAELLSWIVEALEFVGADPEKVEFVVRSRAIVEHKEG